MNVHVQYSTSVEAIRQTIGVLSSSGRAHLVKRCAICRLPVTRSDPTLRLNGMNYHLSCTRYRPGQRLTA
jgi:hypothetical protein